MRSTQQDNLADALFAGISLKMSTISTRYAPDPPFKL